jgi:hypothetical protein
MEIASSASPPRNDRGLHVTPGKLLSTALIASLVAAAFGAAPLAAWVQASPLDGTVQQQAADEWLAMTRRIGLDRPYDVLRHAVRDAEAAH